MLFVAMPPNRRLALERLATPAARRMLARAKIPSPAALARYYAGPFSALRPLARGAVLNRDDRPIVEYRAPRDLIEVGRSHLYGNPQVAAPVPFALAPPAGPLFSAWPREAWFEARASMLAAQGDTARAGMVARAARGEGFADLAQRLSVEIEAAARRERGLVEVERAGLLFNAGRAAEGQQALERALAIDPANGRTWLMLADRRMAAGDTSGAATALARGRASQDPEVRAVAFGLAGVFESRRGHPLAAAELFREAERLNPGFPKNYLLEARARLEAGDAAGARAALRRGLDQLPGDPNLAAMLRSL
jgi:tetratricopeptide (TPR) repeat protein